MKQIFNLGHIKFIVFETKEGYALKYKLRGMKKYVRVSHIWGSGDVVDTFDHAASYALKLATMYRT